MNQILHQPKSGSHVKVKLLSCVWLFAILWTVACQAPLSMGFSMQEYWSGLPFPSPGESSRPGIKLGSPALQATLYCLSHQGIPKSGSQDSANFLDFIFDYSLQKRLSSYKHPTIMLDDKIKGCNPKTSSLVISILLIFTTCFKEQQCVNISAWSAMNILCTILDAACLCNILTDTILWKWLGYSIIVNYL